MAEWDLSLIAHYRLQVVGQRRVAWIISQLNDPSLNAAITLRILKNLEPKLDKTSYSIFSSLKLSRPEVVRTHWQTSQYQSLVVAFSGICCGMCIMVRRAYLSKVEAQMLQYAKYEELASFKKSRSLIDCHDDI
jgi:hypothetical protein